MEGIKEALEFVAGLKDTIHGRSLEKIDGRQYSRGDLSPVREPEPATLTVSTLTGLVDYVLANPDALEMTTGCFLHVVSPSSVVLRSAEIGAFRQRIAHVEAKPEFGNTFPFGRHMPLADFIIGLNALFTDKGDRDQLVMDVAAIKVDAGAEIEDDGISQTVAVKAGARLMTTKKIEPRVTLHPFCTFQEIAQPARSFILRLDDKGQPGLFVADGEAWRGKTMLDIKDWLADRLPEMNILA